MQTEMNMASKAVADPVLALVDERNRVRRAMDELDTEGKSDTAEFAELVDREEALLTQISLTRPTTILGAAAQLNFADMFAEAMRDYPQGSCGYEESWRAYRRCLYAAHDVLAPSAEDRERIGHAAYLNPWRRVPEALIAR